MFKRSTLAEAELVFPKSESSSNYTFTNNYDNNNNNIDRFIPTTWSKFYLTILIGHFILLPASVLAGNLTSPESSAPASHRKWPSGPELGAQSPTAVFSASGATSRSSILGRLSGILGLPNGGSSGTLGSDGDGSPDEDELEVHKLAESCGFSIESHRVTTRDGYILTIHRLVNPLVRRRTTKRTTTTTTTATVGALGPGAAGAAGNSTQRVKLLGAPVIMQHGILCASPFFLMNSSPQLDRPDNGHDNNSSSRTSNSLAIELARRGHDVWLPNFRGTQYSRGHLRQELEPSRSDAYWDFNVDTLIEEDLAAYVNYVLQATGSRRYTFVGHSLGATVGLGALLVHRDSAITRNLSCALLMAPVASTQFMRGRLMGLFKTATLLYGEPAPFPGPTSTFSLFVRQVCPHFRQLCQWLASMFVGAKQSSPAPATPVTPLRWWRRTESGAAAASQAEVGDDREFQNQVNAFLLMMRQSVSVQMLQHIVQVHSSGRLSRFNYGRRQNVVRYGNSSESSSPLAGPEYLAPIYDLSKISEPKLALALVSGLSDAISTPGEIGWISEQVRDKVGHFEQITVPVSPFNHMDLITSSEAGKFVNKRLLEFIQRNKCLSSDDDDDEVATTSAAVD